MSKSFRLVTSLIILALCMPVLVASTTEISEHLGLHQVPVPVAGTGSMYPSLFWETSEGGPDDSEARVVEEYRTTPRMYRRYAGITLLGTTYLRRPVGFGDFVAFQSPQTQAILAKEGKDPDSGLIKRVIGLPGDRLELRDGYLYRNDELLAEPYIYRPRSTYGDLTLADCQTLTIPPGQYFVLGDNRKTSADSRGELGLVADQDISFVLPFAKQEQYQSLWRDPSSDQDLAGTPTLDPAEFYRLVNQARRDHSLPALAPTATLAASARLKASAILAGDQTYSLEQALSQAGYHNIITAELSVRGRFTAQELLSNILYFDNTRSQLLDQQFSEIGVTSLNQAVDACPTEVVVVHLGGYIPPSYESEVVASWQSLAQNLREVIPSWEQARDNSDLDQVKLAELLEIFRRRLALADEIAQALANQEWLTQAQQARIKADQLDASRSQALAEELNN